MKRKRNNQIEHTFNLPNTVRKRPIPPYYFPFPPLPNTIEDNTIALDRIPSGILVYIIDYLDDEHINKLMVLDKTHFLLIHPFLRKYHEAIKSQQTMFTDLYLRSTETTNKLWKVALKYMQGGPTRVDQFLVHYRKHKTHLRWCGDFLRAFPHLCSTNNLSVLQKVYSAFMFTHSNWVIFLKKRSLLYHSDNLPQIKYIIRKSKNAYLLKDLIRHNPDELPWAHDTLIGKMKIKNLKLIRNKHLTYDVLKTMISKSDYTGLIEFIHTFKNKPLYMAPILENTKLLFKLLEQKI